MKEQTTKPGFAEKFRKLVGKWRPAPIQLKLAPPASKRAPGRDASSHVLPGNFYFFEIYLEIALDGVTYLAQPKQALLDTGKTPPVIVWGTPMHLALPHSSIQRIRWIDDAQKGLSRRLITCPEDVLGAEGLFGDKKYRFEQILQKMKHQVVYSLICDENHTRIAYALPREVLDAKKASAKTVN